MGVHYRFFEKPLGISNSFNLSKDNAAHALRVLRLRVNDRVIVCDGDCNEYLCEITAAVKESVTVHTVSQSRNENEPAIPLIIFQSLIKGEKFDFVIQKCVELGVCGVIPFISERSVAAGMSANKLERWQKIAESAAKQSGRGIIPFVRNVLTFRDALEASKEYIAFAAYERCGRESSLKTALNRDFSGKKVCAFIGPEGGFTAGEADMLCEYNIETVSLGKRILRAETAAAAFAANFMYETDG